MNIALCVSLSILFVAFPSTESHGDCSLLNITESIKATSTGLGITGGPELTNHNHYPYTAVLNTFISSSLIKFCGGLLLTSQWVLTASHCVEDKFEEMRVVQGTYNNSTVSTADMHEVTSAIKHPSYSSSPLFENDIALLKLDLSGALWKNIKTVHLPSKTEKFTVKDGTIFGWGKNEMTDDEFSMQFKFVDTRKISDKDCKNTYGKLVTNKICTAGHGKKASFTGDGGGPLMYKDLQIGVSSMVPVVFASERPSIFTDISLYEDWINAYTGSAFASHRICRVLIIKSVLLLIFFNQQYLN